VNADPRTILIFSFGVGVALQALLLARGDWDWLKLIGCILFGGMGLIPDLHGHPESMPLKLLVFFSIFSLAFALMFMKDILQVLSVALVLSYTFVFWFAFFACYYDGSDGHRQLALLALLPSIATVIMAVRRSPMGFVPKLVLYSWFLIMVVSLGMMQFPLSQLKIFFEDEQLPWISPFESFAAGMAFLFLLVNATYVFQLLPIPGRSQSWADRMKEWHEFTDELTQRIGNLHESRARVIVVLGVEGAVLLLSAIYRWLSPGLLINMAIVIPALVLHARPESARGNAD
jgi:hypothetical protein